MSDSPSANSLACCKPSAKLRKNVIGGAILSNVFQHKSDCFVKSNFTKPHKKEKRTPTQIVQVSSLDSVSQ